MDIILRQTIKEIWNIFISLDLGWIKNVCWRNYQLSLMSCTTHILVQLKCMSYKPKVYESKWIPCLTWLVGWFVLLHIY